MFRGRGYRGGGMPNQNFRGGAPGIRGGFQPGRPHANKKESLKFEKDYDFEEANQEFAEVLSKLQVLNAAMFLNLVNWLNPLSIIPANWAMIRYAFTFILEINSGR